MDNVISGWFCAMARCSASIY